MSQPVNVYYIHKQCRTKRRITPGSAILAKMKLTLKAPTKNAFEKKLSA